MTASGAPPCSERSTARSAERSSQRSRGAQSTHNRSGQEIREEREVPNLHRGQFARVVRHSMREQPTLDAFVDAVERREDVAHVEPEQDVARVDLVHEQHASGPKHPSDFPKRSPLLVDRRQVVQDVDRVDEIVRRVGRRDAQRRPFDDDPALRRRGGSQGEPAPPRHRFRRRRSPAPACARHTSPARTRHPAPWSRGRGGR